jgi:ElaB/YqjD/DUF883 family membrane-anchored ribosome-binding protein
MRTAPARSAVVFTNLYLRKSIMLESNFLAVNNDVKLLIADAKALFSAAAALSGEKAEEMRNRGMQLLDSALVKGQSVQVTALARSKEIAVSADSYVKLNPWRIVAAAAGLGLLSGVILGRKES